ncbi:sodium/potassium/calcium exchanger 3-like [Phlebotomus argentipes]|uniref:sodium/potassium/calcium exchanger 3-like n=1 Tax=Phlebotomus argentipes TaxID=94469 RepID=UPI0028937509|nr:sodium/potassium/calcium exchanger 3-like [Phlebotomus argentipes]
MGLKVISIYIISSIIGVCFANAATQRATDTTISPRHDETVRQSHPILRYFYEPHLTLQERLAIERETWHWHPWRRIEWRQAENGSQEEKSCESPSSIDEFPEDIFTQSQRLQGGILLHFLATVYFFTFLAVVVDDFFLPSVECICVQLKISKDVAAATFMATATTMPEFFTNCLSTFLTGSDMGLGTIIGSLLFNTLGVAALAGIATTRPVQLDWWPLVRDCSLYVINISLLTVFAWDGRIYWSESLILFILYFLYFVILFQDKRISEAVKFVCEEKLNCCTNRASHDLEQPKPSNDCKGRETVDDDGAKSDKIPNLSTKSPKEIQECGSSLWTIRRGSALQTIWWLYTWPIHLVLTFLVPNPRTNRKLYPLTFILCIILIGGNSYMIYFMISIIGHTFSIPESVMGLTFVAAGGCLPEAISCIITIRSGEGGMGVSNALGANSLAILLSLGLPWFIRNTITRQHDQDAYINIYSYGIEVTILSLLLAVGVLFLVISLGRYELKRSVGAILLTIYLIFLTLAILIEMDVFFPSGNVC